MRYWLVMPAAGLGRRFGGDLPKQYAPLCGRTVIEWALATFLEDPRCAGAVVVLAQADPWWPVVAARLGGGRPVRTAPGGRERCESVRAGLAALGTSIPATEWVLVHDAARPCVTKEDLDRLVATLVDHPVGGILGAPGADTLKRTSAAGAIVETVDRASLWRALTPQMFRIGRLRDALDAALAANRQPTDEAQAIEWAGERALLVEGASTNIKVTTAHDLLVAAALIAAR